MKLLLDENLSRKLVVRLAELYPESTHVVEVGLIACTDREVWEVHRCAGICGKMMIGTPRSNMTRTIELPLPEELLRLVDERARTTGLPREAYIRAVLSKDVTSGLSISEILAPFRDQVANSGVSDDDLDGLFTQAREESHQERNSHRIDER